MKVIDSKGFTYDFLHYVFIKGKFIPDYVKDNLSVQISDNLFLHPPVSIFMDPSREDEKKKIIIPSHSHTILVPLYYTIVNKPPTQFWDSFSELLVKHLKEKFPDAFIRDKKGYKMVSFVYNYFVRDKDFENLFGRDIKDQTDLDFIYFTIQKRIEKTSLKLMNSLSQQIRKSLDHIHDNIHTYIERKGIDLDLFRR
ncbi:MAG: hypothetical protein QXP36_00220 [Conexivisphaerales archaeon]